MVVFIRNVVTLSILSTRETTMKTALIKLGIAFTFILCFEAIDITVVQDRSTSLVGVEQVYAGEICGYTIRLCDGALVIGCLRDGWISCAPCFLC